MPKTVEFIFDFISPTSYLAYRRLPDIARLTNAAIVWRPVLLGGIFQTAGNASPVSVPAKAKWMGRDMARWAKRIGAPFAFNPHFPMNTVFLLRAAHALLGGETFPAYVEAVFSALWEKQLDPSDEPALAAALSAAGIELAALKTSASTDAVKAALRSATDDAAARGVFGCPTFFVGEEMFFGQDRLDFVEEALAATPALPA